MKKTILTILIIAILTLKIMAQSSSEVIGTMTYEEYIKKKINTNVQLSGFSEGFDSGEIQINGKQIYFKENGLILDLDKDIPKSANLLKMEYKDKVLTLHYKDNNRIILESGNMRRYKDLEFVDSKDKEVKVTREGIELKDGAKLKKVITINDKEKREVIIQQQNAGEKTTVNFISDNYFVGDKNTIVNDNVLGKISPKTDSTKFTYDMNNLVTSMVLGEKNPYTVHSINVNMGAGPTTATQITGDKAIEYQIGFNDNGKQIVTGVKIQGTDKYYPLASGTNAGFKGTALEDFVNSKSVTDDNKQLISELQRIYHTSSGEGTIERLQQEKETRGTGLDKSLDKENYVLLGKNVETTSNKIDLELKGNSDSKQGSAGSALLVVPDYGNVYSGKDAAIHIGEDKVEAAKSGNSISIDKDNGIVNINAKNDKEFTFEQKHNLKELTTNGGNVVNGAPVIKFNPDGTINIERDIRMAEYSIDKIVNSNQKNKDSYLTLQYHENIPGYRLSDSMGRYNIGTTYVDLQYNMFNVNALTVGVDIDQTKVEALYKKADEIGKQFKQIQDDFDSGKIDQAQYDAQMKSMREKQGVAIQSMMNDFYKINKELRISSGVPIPKGNIEDLFAMIPDLNAKSQGQGGFKLPITNIEDFNSDNKLKVLRGEGEIAFNYMTIREGKRPESFKEISQGLLNIQSQITEDGKAQLQEIIDFIRVSSTQDQQTQSSRIFGDYFPSGTPISIGSTDSYGYIKVGSATKTISKDYAKALVNLGLFGSSMVYTPSDTENLLFTYKRDSVPILLENQRISVDFNGPFPLGSAMDRGISLMKRQK